MNKDNKEKKKLLFLEPLDTDKSIEETLVKLIKILESHGIKVTGKKDKKKQQTP